MRFFSDRAVSKDLQASDEQNDAPKLIGWFIPEPSVLEALIRHFDPVEHGWVLSHDQAISF